MATVYRRLTTYPPIERHAFDVDTGVRISYLAYPNKEARRFVFTVPIWINHKLTNSKQRKGEQLRRLFNFADGQYYDCRVVTLRKATAKNVTSLKVILFPYEYQEGAGAYAVYDDDVLKIGSTTFTLDRTNDHYLKGIPV